MERDRLSAIKIQRLRTPGYHCDGAGLYFRVAPGGTRGWIFRFTMHGRTRDMGVGPYPDVSLALARGVAGECRAQVRAGIDPIEARKEKRAADRLATAKAMTFDDCAQAYVAAHEAGWRNADHRRQWVSTLRNYITPVLGKLPVHSIDTGLVMKVVEPLWKDHPETASRVRGRIERILDWAKVRGYRSGENPAAWRGHLDHLLPERSKVARVNHHPALPYSELPSFLAELRAREGNAARALEFTILTAGRTSETLKARWSEFDGDCWTVPGERMKSSRDHRVPLSRSALEILEQLPRVNHFVFAGMQPDEPLHVAAMLRALKRMGRADLTTHGFRSSFMDWAHEQTAFPKVVIDMALAHVVGDKVEAAYRRGDLFEKRRRLMDAWAGYCTTPASIRDEIIPIGKAVR
jgi:integrase